MQHRPPAWNELLMHACVWSAGAAAEVEYLVDADLIFLRKCRGKGVKRLFGQARSKTSGGNPKLPNKLRQKMFANFTRRGAE